MASLRQALPEAPRNESALRVDHQHPDPRCIQELCHQHSLLFDILLLVLHHNCFQLLMLLPAFSRFGLCNMMGSKNNNDQLKA